MSREEQSQFESWVRDHHAAVYGTAFRLVRNAEDAQDVAQEVFLNALEQRAQLASAREPRRVLCWLASKQALMHLRGERRRREREDEVAAMEPNMNAASNVNESQHVRTLLARLPEELRVALTLRFQEDFTFAQMSEAMAISEPSAHARVRRGLEKLKEWMQRSSPALLPFNLEDQLREVKAEPIPAGLREKLLSLETTSVASMTLAAKALLAVITLAVVGVGIRAASQPEPVQPRTETASVELSEPTHASALAAAGRDEPIRVQIPARGDAAERREAAVLEERFATILGVVRQPDGTPAPGVQVVAKSYVGHGLKVAAYGNVAETNERGEYSLRVSIHHDDGEDYEVHVRYDRATLTVPKSVRVQTNEQRDGFDLVLESLLEETPGEFALTLEIVDESETYLPVGSGVTLERYLHTIGNGTFPHWESGGRLSISGRVALSGSKLGPKRVRATAQVGEEWVRYEGFLEVEYAGQQNQRVTVKVVSRSRVGEVITARDSAKFGLSGRARELRTGAPVERSYHDVWVYKLPELSPHELLYDFLPNRVFRGPFQSSAIGEAPPKTDQFSSGYELEPGRYLAIGFEEPYAPAISDVVELTEEFPRANGLQLLYDQPGSVEGIVRDVDGSPLANAVICVTGTGDISTKTLEGLDDVVRKSHGEGQYRMRTWRSDASGRFVIEGLSGEVPIRFISLHPARVPASSRTIFPTPGMRLAEIDIRFTAERTR